MKTDNDTYEILWIRHGESMGNEDEAAYTRDGGDPGVELTDTGWRQAISLGKFLKQYLHDIGDKKYPHIFVGEFTRHEQTLSGILHGIGNNSFSDTPSINPDSRLNEQSFGVLPYMIDKDGDFEQISLEFSRIVREGNMYSARPTHGESRRDAEGFIKSFIDGTLKRDMKEGNKRIIIITSGAVINAATKSWFHLPMKAWNDGTLKNPNNCDIRSFKGKSKDWSVTKIYDGPNANPVNENIIEGIKHLSLDTLPKVPSHILESLNLIDNEPE